MLHKLHLLPFKKIIKWFGYLFVFLTILVSCINYWVIKSTSSQLYNTVKEIPFNKVALLLGANKKTKRGNDNLFFKYRIEAATALYKSGKIKHIIVTGDNHVKEYDEATDMCDALIINGIPDSCITLDYAGFRTFDSMVRCLKVFGQKNVTVISQKFHNQRAVFIGNYYKMNVVAFNAKDVPAQYSFKTKVREYFAKFKAVLDLYILHKQPKFLGEKITLK